jgi:hypothetical protein
MTLNSPGFRWFTVAAAMAVLGTGGALLAFPPAPHHTILGMVRDQLGNPLKDSTAQIVMDFGGSTTFTTTVLSQLGPGENYQFEVPMDSGITDDVYRPNALLPAAPFRLKVQIGNATYVPMEMKGNMASLGQPGAESRIDLTLGTSSNSDGLPDAWKLAVIQRLGLKLTPGQIHPNDPYPGTGLTYYQVYIAGTYYFAPTNGFALHLTSAPGATPRVAFTAVSGRTYTIQGGEQLTKLTPLNFRLSPFGTNAVPVSFYQATNTAKVEVEIPLDAGIPPAQFYQLMVE